ncbi:MAG: hypothetical protein PHT94_01720 [Candidatus Nanoarchaeia archaeon]|nr:hypothetical protein [Candidatus Nanoarchaeia archaeon]
MVKVNKRVILDSKKIFQFSSFGNFFKVTPIEMILVDGTFYVVVEHNSLKKCIDKIKENPQRVESFFGAKVRVVGFSDNLEVFIKNLIYPIKEVSYIIENNDLIIFVESMKEVRYLKRDNSFYIDIMKSLISSLFNNNYNIKIMIKK